jgi:hypothetical protein
MSESGALWLSATPAKRRRFLVPYAKRPSEQTTWRSVFQEGAPTSAQPEQRVFIFSLRFAEAPVEIKQLGGLAVKNRSFDSAI